MVGFVTESPKAIKGDCRVISKQVQKILGSKQQPCSSPTNVIDILDIRKNQSAEDGKCMHKFSA